MMNIMTRDFGEIQIDESSILEFQYPIFGFEQYKKYVFLSEESIGDDFVWLQSVEQPEICFLLVAPHVVISDYCPEIPQNIQNVLGDDDYMCWLIVVLKDTLEESTVNLKSPIVVNPMKKQAAQIILEADLPLRHPLVKGKEAC